MSYLIYILCAVTSCVCALLQWRAYMKAKSRFLLWTTICFVAIFLNNVMLFVDLLTGPTINLVLPRSFVLLGGLCILLYGFIWETS
ncbi:MAG: hypothetical protein KF865_09765 [Bdellovibrionaceae bacterium]|nr:hypothetical protein [Pseudobdellovibrionaceae bacterium]